jgi:hypothetical protein
MYFANARLYHTSKHKRTKKQHGVRMHTTRRVIHLFSPNVTEYQEFFANPAAYFVMKEHWSMDG